MDHEGTNTLVINDHGCLSQPALWDVAVTPEQALSISATNESLCQGEAFTLEAGPSPGHPMLGQVPTARRQATNGHAGYQCATGRFRLVYRFRASI